MPVNDAYIVSSHFKKAINEPYGKKSLTILHILLLGWNDGWLGGWKEGRIDG